MTEHLKQPEPSKLPTDQRGQESHTTEPMRVDQGWQDQEVDTVRDTKERAQIQSIREHLGITSPFIDSLQPTSFDARNIRLWKPKDDPTKLVRESRTKENQTLDQLEQSIREGEALFEKMRAEYGIKVVSMKSLRETNKEGSETIFTIVDKIEGQNLSEVELLPDEAREDLESLYVSLGQHYLDAWKQGQPYWGDGRSDQFVYGTKNREAEKHFYLTDIDPEFYREGDDQWHTIEAALGSVCHDLIESEKKFRPKAYFEKARESLLQIVHEMIEANPDWSLLIEAKNWLEN